MKELIRTLTLISALALVGSACSQPFVDDFNDGNDSGWTEYAPVPPSYFLYPSAAGSGAYQLWAPPGDSSNPGRIGSFRLDGAALEKFHVEADLLNWSENKGQYMGIMARVNVVSGAVVGYGLVLRVSANANRTEDKLLIVRIDAGGTPTELSGANYQGQWFYPTYPYPTSAGSSGYRLVFWSDGAYLNGQIIDRSTGQPLLFSNGSTLVPTLTTSDPGTYSSGRSGLFSYVRIVGSTAQGVDPTFDNFYFGSDAPDTTPPNITCPANVTVGTDSGQCNATGVALGWPSTSDNSGGTVTVWNNAPAQYPQGVTTVTWTAQDPSGNTATCAQTVTVIDTQPPAGAPPPEGPRKKPPARWC